MEGGATSEERAVRRRSDVAAVVGGALLALAAALLVHAQVAGARGEAATEARAALVRRFTLTDLCLFTDARYTRHPSQADRFAPFGEHPHALEHLPSGSIFEPPR